MRKDPSNPTSSLTVISLSLLIGLALAGCQTVPEKPAEPVSDPAITKLLTVGERIAYHVAELHRLEYARNPVRAEGSVPPETGPFASRIAITWQGPAEPLLRKIAEAIGVQFDVIGAPDALPRIVDVRYNDAELAYNVLENVGWQLGDRAGVVVQEGRIRLTYRNIH